MGKMKNFYESNKASIKDVQDIINSSDCEYK